MIHLQPFRAITPPESQPVSGEPLSGEPLSRGSEEGSPSLSAMLARWRAAGLLRSGDKAALHLIEARAVGPRRDLLPSPPVRFLLGRLPQDTPLVPLEDGAARTLTEELEPVVSLVADPDGSFRGLLDEAALRSQPLVESRSDGHVMRLCRIQPGRVSRKLQAALEQGPVRALVPPAHSDRQLGAFVSLAEPGLQLKPFHRGLRGWPAYEEETFLRLVGEYARLYPLTDPLTSSIGLERARERLASLSNGHHAMLAVLSHGRGVILRVRQGIDLGHIPAVPRNPTLRSLDLALLDALVLRTVLGVKDPEAPEHPNVVPVDALEALVERVGTGQLQVGFALNPPPVWEVRAVMEASVTLPPHTLRVEPALPPGLVFAESVG